MCSSCHPSQSHRPICPRPQRRLHSGFAQSFRICRPPQSRLHLIRPIMSNLSPATAPSPSNSSNHVQFAVRHSPVPIRFVQSFKTCLRSQHRLHLISPIMSNLSLGTVPSPSDSSNHLQFVVGRSPVSIRFAQSCPICRRSQSRLHSIRPIIYNLLSVAVPSPSDSSNHVQFVFRHSPASI